jgi:hypothetical protein
MHAPEVISQAPRASWWSPVQRLCLLSRVLASTVLDFPPRAHSHCLDTGCADLPHCTNAYSTSKVMERDVQALARVPCPAGSRFSISWGPGNTISLVPVLQPGLSSEPDASSEQPRTISTVRWCDWRPPLQDHGLQCAWCGADGKPVSAQGSTCSTRKTCCVRLSVCLQGAANGPAGW